MPPLGVGASKNCLCFAVRPSSQRLLGSFGPACATGAFVPVVAGSAPTMPTRAAARVALEAMAIDRIIADMRATALVVLVVDIVKYSPCQAGSVDDSQNFQVLRLHARRPIRCAVVIRPEPLQIAPQRAAVRLIQRRKRTQRRAVPEAEVIRHF